jgi:hypothetical protein
VVPRKTIVCLANSRKLGDRCVAGIDVDSGEWIRPVGSGSHGAVTRDEQELDDGSLPSVLDLISVPLGRAAPQEGQPENWHLGPGRWKKVGELDEGEARKLLEQLATDEPVFGTNARSVSVAAVEAGEVTNSLAVVRAVSLSWVKSSKYGGGTQVRCEFLHAGTRHDLPVTDLAWLKHFAGDPVGEYGHVDSEEVFLVISLGEPMNDEHWKLVAGVVCLAK